MIARIICFFLGHKWESVLINWAKFPGLMHLHPLAGHWAVCHRCCEEWNDLYYYRRDSLQDQTTANITFAPEELRWWPPSYAKEKEHEPLQSKD